MYIENKENGLTGKEIIGRVKFSMIKNQSIMLKEHSKH